MLIGEAEKIIQNYLVASRLVEIWPGGRAFADVNIGHVEGIANPRNSKDACNFVMQSNIRELRAFVFFDQLFIHYYVRATLSEKRFHHVVLALEPIQNGLNLDLKVQTMCPCRGWYDLAQ